jgi:predicted acylesterase/phospholipase RssA
MTIKHLVISGGGPILLQIIATIQYLEANNIFNLSDIQSIYGTSAGSIIGVFICLHFDWETLNDYLIKRPWQEVFQLKAQNIFDSYNNKGIFDIKTIEKCFKPLFDAKDIPIDINLNDFYELTKIELHFFSFEMNEYKMEDISYITYPKLSLIKAVQMSCCVPLLFTPVFIENKCFIDGGISCNYPLNYCIESGKNSDEIFGFKKILINRNNTNSINTNSTIIDFVLYFLYRAVFNINKDSLHPEIKNEISYDMNVLSVDLFHTCLSSTEYRKELFNKGIEIAVEYVTKLKLQNSI